MNDEIPALRGRRDGDARGETEDGESSAPAGGEDGERRSPNALRATATSPIAPGGHDVELPAYVYLATRLRPAEDALAAVELMPVQAVRRTRLWAREPQFDALPQLVRANLRGEAQLLAADCDALVHRGR